MARPPFASRSNPFLPPDSTGNKRGRQAERLLERAEVLLDRWAALAASGVSERIDPVAIEVDLLTETRIWIRNRHEQGLGL